MDGHWLKRPQKVVQCRSALTVFKPIGNNAKRERLSVRECVLAIDSMGNHARKIHDLRETSMSSGSRTKGQGDSASVHEPDLIAAEISEDLRAAPEHFEAIAADLAPTN